MKQLENKVAVITGAGSGIGRELAVGMAALGSHLAISDVNEKRLEETAAMLREHPVRVTAHTLDVADRNAVHAHADDVKNAHGHVDIVINNAGVAMGCPLETLGYEDFEWLMNINFWGVVYGTKAFLPLLKSRKEGHIVNISSINGIIPSPYGGPYACSKYAVRAFTETLMIELKDTNICFSVVHPGGIQTQIARDARFLMTDIMSQIQSTRVYEEKIFKTSAKKAAQIIIKGIQKKQQRIMVGSDAKVLDWFRRIFPMASLRLVGNMTLKMMKG